MKVVDEELDGHNPRCVVLLPEVPDEKLGDGRDKYVRKSLEDGESIVINAEDGKQLIGSEDPNKMLSRKLTESETILKKFVNDNIETSDTSLEFPKI